jgi:hypothetical protein
MGWIETIATVAPTIATALGNPLAALALKTACESMGITQPSESALKTAVESGDPTVLLNLQRADQDFQVRLKELDIDMAQVEAARIASVNQTMQAEAQAAHWPTYTWRPFTGFVAATLVLMDYCILPLLRLPVPEVPDHVWLYLGTVLGVASWGHSKALADPGNLAVTRG